MSGTLASLVGSTALATSGSGMSWGIIMLFALIALVVIAVAWLFTKGSGSKGAD